MRMLLRSIAGTDPSGTGRTSAARLAVFIFGLAVSAAVLLRFYDRMWLPRDDGYYAHIAERILAGEVLHRDVQALHPGYVYFVDALSLRLFGRDLVSLRYPLVALGVVQAALVGALFLRHSAVMAATASLLFTSLGYVLLPTPSVHWYCLFLLVLIVCAVEWVPKHSAWRPLILGLLVGVLGLFRQLTGAFVGAGVVAYLLAEPNAGGPAGEPAGDAGGDPRRGSGPSPPHAAWIIGAAGAVVSFYALTKGSPLARSLFGIWVTAVSALAAWRAIRSPRPAGRLVLLLAAGGAVAAAPLLAYHLAHRSLGAWFNDSVVSAVGLSELKYVQVRRYAEMIGQAARQVVGMQGLRPVVNGAFWLALMFAPAVLGVAVGWRLLRGRGGGTWPHALPFLAVFYAPVAIHFEAPAYVFFAAAPVACGLLWLAAEAAASHQHRSPNEGGEVGPAERRVSQARGHVTAAGAVLAAALASYVALRYQAAQPVARGHVATVAGQRTELAYAEGIEGLGLRISSEDVATYAEVIDLIRRHTDSSDAIVAVPGGAEFHFLSGRRNPLPYPYIVYGVMDDESLDRALAALRRDPPALVIHVPSLPYNTRHTDRLMEELKAGATLIATVREFNVYTRNRPTSAPAGAAPTP